MSKDNEIMEKMESYYLELRKKYQGEPPFLVDIWDELEEVYGVELVSKFYDYLKSK